MIMTLPAMVMGQFKTIDEPVTVSSLLHTPASMARSTIGIMGLDPDRLTISQSYQMGYMSIGGQGVSQATYLNTMTYHFKLPMTLSVQWGISHQPFGGNDKLPMMQNGPFLSGARLHYEPSKNMAIDLEYSQVPYGYGYSYLNRYNRW